MPVLREWFATIVASGGMGVVILLIGVGVAGWAWGKTQMETGDSRPGGAGSASGAQANGNAAPPPRASGAAPGAGAGPIPKPSWQRSTGPGPTPTSTGTATGGWEKAREETRKKEEERKKAEELRKKKEQEESDRHKQREKDSRERDLRERKEKEAKERAARSGSPYKRPTARTATDDDAASYSYRPYDKPTRPVHKTASASSMYSESSYAPSHSTSRTTPPPSHRGPYHTKDPDKIVIKAVYSFNNAFTKLPIAQLVSGVGSVTDGLILRITTEGLFIDDDVRGIPQREWDVKAWTMKLVEVWCPYLLDLGAVHGSAFASRNVAAGRSGMFGMKTSNKERSSEEMDSFLASMISICKLRCSGSGRSAASTLPKNDQSNSNASFQSGTHKGLHVLRATIRDAEGKRYVFVLPEEEGWKVAVGLQRLRRGSQVRAMGVSGMNLNETKAILDNLGFT